MAKYDVRIMTGNDTQSQTVRVEATDANKARAAAEGQTGGTAKGQSQVSGD